MTAQLHVIANTVTEIPFQDASMDIWDTKYRLKTKDGVAIDGSIDETYQRVAKALSEVEKNKAKQDQYYKEFLWALRQGVIPAGRIVSNAGALAHKPSTSTINCFAYETPVLTNKGVFPIGELAAKNETVEVLNGNGEWSAVTFKSFGQQEVHTLAFKYADNKEVVKVRVTKNHRWILKSGTIITSEFWLTTHKLKSFKKIDNIFSPSETINSDEYKLGVLHGATYGDGSFIKDSEQRYYLHLIGNKLDIIPYLPDFIGSGVAYDYVNDENQRFTFESTIPLKELPSTDLCTYSYLKGFFAGILATDGSIHSSEGNRSVSLCVYGDTELMTFLKKYLPIIGVCITHCKKDFGRGECSNYGERKQDVFRMNIHPSTVDVKDVLRGFHLNHFYQTANGAVKSKEWTFVNISDSVDIEEVYCCTELVTGSFCLFHGLLTGNCTVSGTIADSMDDILHKVHEAGLTLKAGCGIGYEFSTLRPKDAYVSGAGAYTSGPLSFMDIYDKMCFTVSSAGGRRGAQMATFDIAHPDVVEFIRAKREDGRLRQFNLSLLITAEFMQAVKNDALWALSFPVTEKEAKVDKLDLQDSNKIVWRDLPSKENYIVNEAGLVACKITKTIPARRLWDIIMSSTYDYAEPGFILIDKVNEMNNNWFCEKIRATNPCVTADTRLHTQYGMVKIGDLYTNGAKLNVTVDNRSLELEEKGTSIRPAKPAFMTAASADVYRVTTQDGYEIKATEWHDFYTDKGKIKLKDLKLGDKLLIQSGKGQFGTQGDKNFGNLLGLITGDGHFTNRGKNQQAAIINLWNNDRVFAPQLVNYINQLLAITNIQTASLKKSHTVSAVAVPERNMVMIRSILLARLLALYGFNKDSKLSVPEVIWQGTEDCVKGYLSALFQADGTVQRDDKNSYCTIRLASSYPQLLKDVQMLLSNFGVFCRILKRRQASFRTLPDGKGGQKSYACKADYELIIGAESRDTFMREIGFLGAEKNEKYAEWAKQRTRAKANSYTSPIVSIEYIGKEAVFDTTQNDHNTLIFNGIVTGNCGEQPLPPYGSCLLGSINLTRFVKKPFTADAHFDWASYRKTIRIFTRMLDNVVEINGLPLEKQRQEILSKRRHGMGYLGLGSTVTMLGMRYGDSHSVQFTEDVTKILAIEGWKEALTLAKEKGSAPIMEQQFTVTSEMLHQRPEMLADGYKVGDTVAGKILHAKYSRYMQQLAKEEPELIAELIEVGARFTHHSSIAPTGTISLSLANNASNGIEPSFAHHYSRNIIRQGKKSKEKVDVFSFELLAYREMINEDAMPYTDKPEHQLPAYFIAADDVTPKQHVDIQAAAQKWIDSSISKTANVPTDFAYEDFKDIYQYAYDKGLKGCTTFRFNPEVFQGVLVKASDLENTTYQFTLEDGEVIELKGNDEIEYDGEIHSAANLFDALKEGYYGKL